MKPVEELVVTVCDYGTFISLAERLAKTFRKVNYHAPIDREFRSIRDAVLGYGISSINRIEGFMHPDIVSETDLYVFPDIGYSGEQAYLKSIGKPVWGSQGADELERLRTRFISVIEKLGLPILESKKLHGLTELSDYLKDHKNLWIKVNEFREDMETWKHQDWEHSRSMLNNLATTFGGASELVWFVAQEDLPEATEIGYDGLSVDGWFPDSSFHGYEKKNELYLGSKTQYDDLPEEIRLVNEKFSPVMQEYGYRNFFATEIRNYEGIPYFIDPTLRMPGQTGEQLLNTMDNLPEVVWLGSQGELLQPIWNAKFATSATIHHKGNFDEWRVARVNDDAKEFVKFCRYMEKDGLYHFPPGKSDDLGVVIGTGETIEDAIGNLKENFENIGDESLSINPEGFSDLLRDIRDAEDEGIEFTDQPVPTPEVVVQ